MAEQEMEEPVHNSPYVKKKSQIYLYKAKGEVEVYIYRKPKANLLLVAWRSVYFERNSSLSSFQK